MPQRRPPWASKRKPCFNWDRAKAEPWWEQANWKLGPDLVDKADSPKVGPFILPENALYNPDQRLMRSKDIFLGSPFPIPPSRGKDDSVNNQSLTCAPGEAYLKEKRNVAWQQEDADGNMIDYLLRRYTLYTIPPDDSISVVGQVKGNTIVPWNQKREFSALVIKQGSMTLQELLREAEDPVHYKGLQWTMRILLFPAVTNFGASFLSKYSWFAHILGLCQKQGCSTDKLFVANSTFWFALAFCWACVVTNNLEPAVWLFFVAFIVLGIGYAVTRKISQEEELTTWPIELIRWLGSFVQSHPKKKRKKQRRLWNIQSNVLQSKPQFHTRK